MRHGGHAGGRIGALLNLPNHVLRVQQSEVGISRGILRTNFFMAGIPLYAGSKVDTVSTRQCVTEDWRHLGQMLHGPQVRRAAVLGGVGRPLHPAHQHVHRNHLMPLKQGLQRNNKFR